MFSHIKGKSKKEDTEVSSEGDEEEETLTGARMKDISSIEEEARLQWLEEHPQLKADAMKQYDRKMLDGLE
eukprot:15675263-Heterocapsa_arctica.AAC.1